MPEPQPPRFTCRDCGHNWRRGFLAGSPSADTWDGPVNVSCPQCGGIADPDPRDVRQEDEPRHHPDLDFTDT